MIHYTKQNILADRYFDDSANKMFLCLQDAVHIATKLRNRLLVSSILLILGNNIISISHLKMLINNVPKSDHGLVVTDICPTDRQNFSSMQKMMAFRVTDALSKHIIGSEGTVTYLKLCELITASLTKSEITPLERIEKIWYATFFLRIWREWIKQTDLSVEDNFITGNAYKCIEINATNLLLLTKRFRDEKISHLYMPSLFNSQPNEEMFRTFRSMVTINYTKINFTLLELFHLVGRVELLNDIIYFKLADTGIYFPRNKLNETQWNKHKLPTDEEIAKTVNMAKTKAISDALNFQIMITDMSNVENCVYLNIENVQRYQIIPFEEPGGNFEEENEDNTIYNEAPSSTIEITCADGTKKEIRKTTYIWTLTNTKNHLSSDRLKRVQESKALAKATTQ